ncbi:MAG: CPBP family intramembrane metalloprotease [Myxococcales bacterium]|nr:CPBP family intramembrane metalloprotease [Myxococcales bacterium]
MLPRALPWLLGVFVWSWVWAAIIAMLRLPTVGVGFFILALPYVLGPALITAVWRRRVVHEAPFEDLNVLRIGNPALAGWLGAIGFVWLAALIASLCGWGTFDLTGAAIAQRMSEVQGPEKASEALIAMRAGPLPYALLASLQALMIGLLYAPVRVAEELGFRGVLPRELGALGPKSAALVAGLLWGVWRIPLVWMGGYFADAPVAGTVAMVAASIPQAVLLVALARWAKTVWAPAIAQGVLTAIGPFQELVLIGGDPVLTSPMGAAGGVAALVGVLVLWSSEAAVARRLPPTG